MGYGDELMASGCALRASRENGGKPVVIVDKFGRPRWHEVWNHLPFMLHSRDLEKMSEDEYIKVTNGSGCRPYIKYPFHPEVGYTGYTGWRVRDNVGLLNLTMEEKSWAEDQVRHRGLNNFVIVEPTIPPRSNKNKDWGFRRWVEMVSILDPGIKLIQMGPKVVKETSLPDVEFVHTGSFRLGAALLDLALMYVGVEGGMHHAAGVLRKPGVVLFGGTTSPEATGYPWHENVTANLPGTPCGRWDNCTHCLEEWDAITPKHVAEVVERKYLESMQYTFPF